MTPDSPHTPRPSPDDRPPLPALTGWRWPALRTALIFVVIGCLWIVFSDMIAGWISRDSEMLNALQMWKGFLFMVANAALIYILIAHDLKRLRRTELNLRRSESSLRHERDFSASVLQAADAMIIVLDAHGRVVEFNRAAENFTGLNAEAVSGHAYWDEFVMVEERDRVLGILTGVRNDRNQIQFEHHMKNRAGESRLISWRGAFIFSEAGFFESVVLIGLDISEQRVSEREWVDHRSRLQELVDTQSRQLSRSEKIFRLVFDHVFDGIVLMNDDLKIVDVNRGITRLLDLPREELIPMGAADILAPASIEPFRAAAARLNASNSTEFLRLNLRSRQGASIPVEAGGVHITIEGEGRMIWSFRDITSRLRAEEEITKLTTAVQQSPSMILIAGTNKEIIYCNPRFENISGFSLQSIAGHPLLDVFCASDSPVLFDTIWSEVSAGQPWRGEVISHRQSGEPYWQQASISPVKNEAGDFTHVILVAEEITEKKTAENALHQFADELAQKTEELNEALAREKELGDLRSRFIAMVSHEIRTPLTTIQAASDILMRYSDKLTPVEREERLAKIQDQVQLMTRMLEDVLVLGEGNTAFRPAPRLTPLPQILNGIIEDIQSIMTPEFSFKHSIRLDRDDIVVDEHAMRQVFTNLLTNAMKYSPGGGNIYFSVVCVNQVLNAFVQDEGQGIPEEDQPHIFAPFHRGGNVENIQGTGLGLAIVKQAVDRMGGTIHVRSRMGKGSIFTLTIPLDSPPAN